MSVDLCYLNIDTNMHEKKVHGTPSFPCGCYHADVNNYISSEIPWHFHEEVEVITVKSGTAHVKLGSLDFIINAGEGIFINSSVLHFIEIFEGESCVLNSLVFHSNLISGMEDNIIEKKYVRPILNNDSIEAVPFTLKVPWNIDAIQYIKNAYNVFEDELFGYELIVRENLSKLWLLIAQNMNCEPLESTQVENQDTFRIKTMLNFIKNNYASAIELKQIADSANISERECLRCFKKTIAVPPIQYLIKHRIAISAKNLIETDIPITQIMALSGFDNHSYFSLVFKRFMGCTPSFYRKYNKTKVGD